MSNTYYNEFDPKAAAWLRQLIKNGLIADGGVDERNIIDVKASELYGYKRCHFFAGIGSWDYALKLAGWPNDKPVWTASLPCQPFSVAGKGKGKFDGRHLLPHFIELVKEYNPATIFGEQVTAAIKHGWFDDLYTEMEACGYAIGAVIVGAHSVGRAHIRQRLYWVAHSSSEGSQWRLSGGQNQEGEVIDGYAGCSGADSGMVKTGALSWLPCGDGKIRPIKSGLKPLVDGLPGGMVRIGDTGAPFNVNETGEARTMRLKGYGNAIVPELAVEFIKAFMQI